VDLDTIESLSAKLEQAKETDRKLANSLATKDEQLEKKDKDIEFLKGQITHGKCMSPS
jgi:chromosome segregation ATPase